MVPIKIIEVADEYDELLEKLEVTPQQHDHKLLCQSQKDALAHVRSMVPRLKIHIANGDYEKAFRWLGWIQGVLWSQGLYTLEEERNHNKPSID